MPPAGPGPHWLHYAVLGGFVLYFTANLVWWLTRGRYLVNRLVHEMKLEEGSESFENRSRSVEDRLDELERLKRRDMVTPEEYAAKRTEILKDL